MASAISTLIPWYGSDRMIATHIGKLLDGNEWVGIPFAGGMSIIKHINARTIVANDKHLHVINLARVAADRRKGPELYRRLRRLAFHAKSLQEAQDKAIDILATWEDSGEPPVPCIGAAEAYFVSQWMGRSGIAGTDREFNGGLSVRWNAGGGDSVVRYRNAVHGLIEWHKLLERCTFTCMDALEFIDQCKDQDGHAIYVDSPFPGPGDKYRHKVNEDFLRRLAVRLALFGKTKVVIRYYDHPLIRELYPEESPPAIGWTWHHLEGRAQTNESRPEVLITNFNSKSELF